MEKIIITEELIEQGKSRNGGWSLAQLALFGFRDFRNGWKKQVIGRTTSRRNANRFIAWKDAHLDDKPVKKIIPKTGRKVKNRKQRRAAIRDGYRFGLSMTCKEDYQKYLLSKWWQNKRRDKVNSASRKCEECGSSGVPLHVHHIHYLSLGRERNTDLLVLCEPCHKKKHPGWE